MEKSKLSFVSVDCPMLLHGGGEYRSIRENAHVGDGSRNLLKAKVGFSGHTINLALVVLFSSVV